MGSGENGGEGYGGFLGREEIVCGGGVGLSACWIDVRGVLVCD